MAKIQHSEVEVKGLKLHVAEIGSGHSFKTLIGILFIVICIKIRLIIFVYVFMQAPRQWCSCMDSQRSGTHGGTK